MLRMVSVGAPVIESGPLGRLLPDLHGLLFYAEVMRDSPLDLTPTMLDAACGSGHHVVQAGQAGWDVVALEASADLLAYTEERARRRGYQCFPRLGTIDSYRGPEDAFDLVLLAGAVAEEIESVSSLVGLVEVAAPLLRPRGVLAIGIALDDPALRSALPEALTAAGLEVLSLPERAERPGIVGYAVAERPAADATRA